METLMEFTLKQIADAVGGTLIGNPQARVYGLGSLDDAVEGQITFLANPKYAARVATTKATAVILPQGSNGFGKEVIESSNPYLAFAKLLTLFHTQKIRPQGVLAGAFVSDKALLGTDITVYPGAYIGDGVTVGDRVVIYPGAVIYEDVCIGNDVTIHANVSIRERSRIGNRVIIHNGAVIGSDGFGYVPEGKRSFKIPQVGIVVIEDDVEIGANSTIDRAALDITRVGRGCKIDNLVQIAHNCTLGEDSVMAAQSGIAGSSKIGRNVTIGGQVAISGHLTVCDNAMFGGKGGVTSDVTQPGVYSGTPAIPHKEWLRSSLIFAKLPELKKTILHLEQRINVLEKQIEENVHSKGGQGAD